MTFLQRHAKTAMGYFLVAALLGVVLRSFQAGLFAFNYRNMVHTHSHIALLGWVYLALTTMMYRAYLEKTFVKRPYQLLFWVTQLSLLGMLLSFPFQGYALYSIIFSTLFLFVSYGFTWLFVRHVIPEAKRSPSFRLLRASLFYLVLSSLGPWALGAIMNTLGPASDWYRIAIYYYLHFQYNGWMFLGLLGLVFFVAEKGGLAIEEGKFNIFFKLLNTGILLSFLLSVLWTRPGLGFYLLAGLGALIQCAAVGMLIRYCFRHGKELGDLFSLLQRRMLMLVGFLLCVKVLLQALTSIPYFAELAVRILDFTIAYLHWTFLGVISLTLFVLLDCFGLCRIPPKALYVYLIGFALSEALIIYKGVAAWMGMENFTAYSYLLTFASLAIPIGLLGWFTAPGFKNIKV